MHSYLVIVSDKSTKKQTLSIPCAESETAVLVQKNLQSLFPSSFIQIEALLNKSSQLINVLKSAKNQTLIDESIDYAELEENLFEDVA
jgi:hypothetical protein